MDSIVLTQLLPEHELKTKAQKKIELLAQTPKCLLIQEEKAKKKAKARKRAEVLEGLGVELCNASLVGKEARVGQLLKLGIDVNYVMTKKGPAKGFFPLFVACHQNRVEVVRLLLAVEGVSVNQARTIDGCFPLYIACQNNHVEVVRLLLAAQAQVNQVTHGGWSACHKAAGNGHVQVLEMLLEARQEGGPLPGMLDGNGMAQNDHPLWPADEEEEAERCTRTHKRLL